MLGKNSGVAKRLKDEHPKALEMHCLGHCLNLSVSSVNNVSRGMKDCMDVCLEIIKLIKFSPKREAKLEELKLKDLVETESHEELESNDYGQTNGDRERPLKLKNSVRLGGHCVMLDLGESVKITRLYCNYGSMC